MTPRQNHVRLMLVALVAGIAALCLAAAGASGSSASINERLGPGAGPVVGNYHEKGRHISRLQETDSQIRAYWTPERLASARPPDDGQSSSPPALSPTVPKGVGNETTERSSKSPTDSGPGHSGPAPAVAPFASPVTSTLLPTASATAASVGSSTYNEGYLGGASYIPQVGRLYSTTPTGTEACSATVVGLNLVLTAAHCVTDVNGNNYSNFIFAPAQYGKSLPYGTWTARGVSRWNAYWQVRDPGNSSLGFGPLDYAFLIMNQNNGQSIGQGVGNSWFDILLTPPTSGEVYDEGYPAQGDFNTWCPWQSGNWSCYIWFCDTTISGYRQVYPGWWEVVIGCDTGPGASGGPWFQQSGGTWHVGSVESTVWNMDPPSRGWGPIQHGPYFGSTGDNAHLDGRYVLALYNEAAGS